MQKVIGILEDDLDIQDLIAINLKKNHYEVKKFSEASFLFEFLEENSLDLLILDLMLPDMDGVEVCKKIKSDVKLKKIPIIMLTAKTEVIDKVIGLEMGADDYVTKPFSPRELMARVKAVLRRSNLQTDEEIKYLGEELEVNLHKFEAKLHGKLVNLTTTEFKILALLLKKRGWVYSRNKILDFLYGNEKMVIDRTVDVHIRNLRKKLKTAGKYIKNIRGIGYKLEE